MTDDLHNRQVTEVARGGVEPPTFRFSIGLCAHGRPIESTNASPVAADWPMPVGLLAIIGSPASLPRRGHGGPHGHGRGRGRNNIRHCPARPAHVRAVLSREGHVFVSYARVDA